MRGCKVKISVPLLLELIGFYYNDGIKALDVVAETDWQGFQTINLSLIGEDDRLPEVEEGKPLPDAQIICKTVVSHFEVIKNVPLSPQLDKKIDEALKMEPKSV